MKLVFIFNDTPHCETTGASEERMLCGLRGSKLSMPGNVETLSKLLTLDN